MKMKTELAIFLNLLCTFSVLVGFEIRDASFEPDPSFIEMSLVTGENERKVFVGHEALLTGADVEDAFVGQTGTSTYNEKTTKLYGIHVILTESGGEKLKKVTESHLGKPLAILVDGELASAPVVHGVLSKNFSITCSSKKEAEALVQQIITSRDEQRLPARSL